MGARRGTLFGRLSRSRWLSRFFRGQRPERGPVRLETRRIYILPTREGLAAMFTCAALTIGAINYQASLGLALAFLLAGVALVSMLHTQRNLARLTVTVLDADPRFPGERARFPVRIDNPGRRTRYGVALVGEEEDRQVFDAGPGRTDAVAEHLAVARGVHPLGHLTVETYFPLRFFRAWAPILSGAELVVYPRPGGRQPWPETVGDREREETSGLPGRTGDGELAALREYLPGDPPARIDWKATARSPAVMVKEFAVPGAAELRLRYEDLPGLAPEARLSQLCRWVLDAERAGREYTLELPGSAVPRGCGPLQQRRCLEALARFSP